MPRASAHTRNANENECVEQNNFACLFCVHFYTTAAGTLPLNVFEIQSMSTRAVGTSPYNDQPRLQCRCRRNTPGRPLSQTKVYPYAPVLDLFTIILQPYTNLSNFSYVQMNGIFKIYTQTFTYPFMYHFMPITMRLLFSNSDHWLLARKCAASARRQPPGPRRPRPTGPVDSSARHVTLNSYNQSKPGTKHTWYQVSFL